MNEAIKSKALLNGARDQSCVCCGVMDGTVVACHYQGMRSNHYGKGVGRKPEDIFVADLCSKCHRSFDNYEVSDAESRTFRRIDHSEQFQHYILVTIKRRIQQGLIQIK